MNFIEYNKQIDSTISRILDENLLFWNLWCMSFVFDKIETDYKYYSEFETCFDLLWSINDYSLNYQKLNNNASCNKIMNFSIKEYQKLNDFNTSQKAVKEFINGIQNLLVKIKKSNRKIQQQSVSNKCN